jgi:hypothetical protein
MVSEPQTPAGGCPAGYARVSVPGVDDSGLCFRHDGTPVTFTSAEVTWGPFNRGYQFIVTLPDSEAPALPFCPVCPGSAAARTMITEF